MQRGKESFSTGYPILENEGGWVPVTRGISLLEATDLVGIVVLGGNAASTTRELTFRLTFRESQV